ncbi:MAG: DUF4131 domain-containing protein [Alphaproteobacteria bacterium]|nr:DUF4131 domain-containing protein [Alphaproteobacteria bacterium]
MDAGAFSTQAPARASFAFAKAAAAAWAAQRDRWILWLPVAVVAGAAAWIAAPSDPRVWAYPALFALGVALAGGVAMSSFGVRDGGGAIVRTALIALGLLAAAAGLGGSAAQARAQWAAAPIVRGETEPLAIEGWVVALEPSATRQRARLLVRAIEGMDAPPRFVRVSIAGQAWPAPGRAVRCRAILRPPNGPIAPGAYDFARRAYFERLGATGFALGPCRPIRLERPELALDRARLQLAAWRADLTALIYAAAPGPGGAVAAALVTGDRSLIPESANETLRDSGLGHLISVSGLHMGVVGGIVFVSLLAAFSLIPAIALRVSARKLAAGGALIALTAYLFISGASVPAIRAYVMACVAFGAVLIDRPAISMRGLGLALLLITLALPESVLEPGFQMSFAATAALVAAFEAGETARRKDRLPAPGPLIGALETLQRGAAGVLAISLVAGLATEPFAIFHFQRLAAYGLPVNLIVAPIVSFLIAPAAVAALVLTPTGWSDEALGLMAWACELVLGVAQAFAERPEAVRAMPRPPDAAFLLCVAALVWACVWRGPVRFAALAPAAAAIGLYALTPAPVLAFDRDLRVIYGRSADAGGEPWRRLNVYGRSAFARERMGEMLGLSPLRVGRLAAPEGCDPSAPVCAWRAGGFEVRAVLRAEGFAAPCAPGAVVFSRWPAPGDFAGRCRPAALIDAADLAAHGGGFAVLRSDGALDWRRTQPYATQRAWTPWVGGADDDAP